jgi:hypothetical protein
MPEHLWVIHLEDGPGGRSHPVEQQHSETLSCKLSGGALDLMEHTHNKHFSNGVIKYSNSVPFHALLCINTRERGGRRYTYSSMKNYTMQIKYLILYFNVNVPMLGSLHFPTVSLE